MFVAASSRCFADLPLDAALERLVDLEFTAVELMIHENGGHIKPSELARHFDQSLAACRNTRRLTPAALSVDIEAPESEALEQFAACCRLAKAMRVVTITIRGSELGVPFNAEIERLRSMADIAVRESIRLGLLTEVGRVSEDPDTAVVFCDHVKGLGITLDPSHFIFQRREPVSYEPVLKHTIHVRLRDTTRDALAVRVGQGQVEYGRLVNQLGRFQYQRALTVDIWPLPEVDQRSELRKMRLLLESLL